MRPFTKTVKKTFGEAKIVGAEIGVGAGWNAKDMFNNLPNLRLLYLVDPHEKYDGYVDRVAKDMLEVTWKQMADKLLENLGDRKKWVRKHFEDCTKEDISEPLDFIYIDGNHKYDYVKQDIIHAFAFVKPHAVIGGHDYANEMYGPEVSAAVKDYCLEHSIKYSAGEDDWWFII